MSTISARLIAVLSALFLFTGALAGIAWTTQRQQANALAALYENVVVDVRDLKLVSDRYAVDIVDAAHKARNGNMSFAEAEKAMKSALVEIDKVWTKYADQSSIAGKPADMARQAGLKLATARGASMSMIAILEKHGLSGSVVRLEKVLHLKTGLAYLEHNNLLAAGEFVSKPEFQDFNIIEIPEEESYAANCIWVNERVIMPAGYPRTREKIARLGYRVIEVDTSEYRKIDGGVSCMSLRF